MEKEALKAPAAGNLGPEAAIPTAFFVFACIITASILTEIWKTKKTFRIALRGEPVCSPIIKQKFHNPEGVASYLAGGVSRRKANTKKPKSPDGAKENKETKRATQALHRQS